MKTIEQPSINTLYTNNQSIIRATLIYFTRVGEDLVGDLIGLFISNFFCGGGPLVLLGVGLPTLLGEG